MWDGARAGPGLMGGYCLPRGQKRIAPPTTRYSDRLHQRYQSMQDGRIGGWWESAKNDAGRTRTCAPEGTSFLGLRDNHSATAPEIVANVVQFSWKFVGREAIHRKKNFYLSENRKKKHHRAVVRSIYHPEANDQEDIDYCFIASKEKRGTLS